MTDFLKEDEPSFSKGGKLEDLNYVVFALGNRTYEMFCASALDQTAGLPELMSRMLLRCTGQMGKTVDEALARHGGTRVGEVGEGDDDKSMEEGGPRRTFKQKRKC